MVDTEIKRALKGQNVAWNIVFVIMGGILFGAGMEMGRASSKYLMKNVLKLPVPD